MLKKIIFRYLAYLVVYVLLSDLLNLLVPSFTTIPARPLIQLGILSGILLMLLKELYREKVGFVISILSVLLFPLVLHFITVCSGNIFIHFCPEKDLSPGENGITDLIDAFSGNDCPFITRFNFFYYLEQPVFYFKRL